jgi:hypothetical protein
MAAGSFPIQIADPHDQTTNHPIVLLDKSSREF